MPKDKKETVPFKKRLTHLIIGFGVSIFIIAISYTAFYEIFELKLYDQRFVIRGPIEFLSQIATIDIDDFTVGAEGRYQDWTRDKYAKIITWIKQLNGRLIGFDIYFLERSLRLLKFEDIKKINQKNVKNLESLFQDYDGEMIRAMHEAGNVILGQYLNMNPEDADSLELKSIEIQKPYIINFPDAAKYKVKPYTNLEPILPEFSEAAAATGAAMTIADIDGAVRHYPVVFLHQNKMYPSLALIMLCKYIGINFQDVTILPGKYVDLPEGKLPDGKSIKIRIPVDENCMVLVNWAGDYWEKNFLHVPYAAISTYMKLRKKMTVAQAMKNAFIADKENVENTDKLSTYLKSKGIEDDDIIHDVYSHLYNCYMLEQAIREGKEFTKEELPPDVWSDYVELKANHDLLKMFDSNPAVSLDEVLTKFEGKVTRELVDHGYAVIKYLRETQGGIKPENYPLFFYEPEIEGRILSDADFKGKIFFFGLTAAGTWDLNPMPFNQRYPMLGLHANALNMFLQNNFLLRIPKWMNIIIMLVLGFLMGLIVPKIKPLPGAIVVVLFIVGYMVSAQFIFQDKGYWIDLFGPLLVITLGYLTITVYNFFSEEKEKKMIRGMFSRYVTKSVVDAIIQNPDMIKLGGERKICTVFFSDVAGFTTISESLTPEELVALLNEYLTAMTNIVLKYDGMIDKYEGDAIMAVFGTPIVLTDHATRACYVSLEMQEELVKMRAKWKQEGKPELSARIGLNTGPMIAGNMGAQDRLDYTVMGDSVNLGSRLEGANKQYGTYIMISEFTLEHVKNDIESRFLDSLRVKGKKLPVKVYEVIARKENGLSPEKRKIIELYNQGVECYLKQQWLDGIKFFESALDINSDPPSGVYLERCKQYLIAPPPPEWDGVYIMTTK